MPAEIGIKITGDASGLASASKEAGQALNGISDAVNSTGASLSNFSTAASSNINKLENRLKQLKSALDFAQNPGPGVNKSTDRINELTGSIAKLQTRIASLKGTAVPVFNELQQSVAAFGGGVRNTNPAALAFAQSIKGVGSASKDAAVEATNLGTQAAAGIQKINNPISQAYGAIRKLAFVLPGIGVAGIFGLIGESIVQLGKALFDTATQAQFLKDKQDELNKSIGDSQAKTAGEIAEVKSLVAIASDEALSRDARTEALKKLNSLYPGYFTNTTLDGKTTEKLKQATDALTSSILLNAKAKAIQSEIEKSAQRVSDAANGSGFDQLTILEKLNFAIKGLTFGRTEAQITAASQALKDFGKLTDNENALQSSLAKQLTDTNKQLAVQGSLFDDSKAKKQGSDNETLQQQISDINKQISALEELRKQGIATRTDLQELFSLKIQKVNLELPTSGFSGIQADRLIQNLEFEANEALKSKPITFLLPVKVDIQNLEHGIDTSKAQKGFEAAGRNIAISLRDELGKGAGTIDIGEALNKTVSDNLVPAIEGIAVSVGDAVSGGGFASVLKGVANAIGDFIIDFGKLLIKSAIEVKLLTEAAKKLATVTGPVAAIAIGFAAIAIGTIIKNTAKGPKQKGFAQGGIAEGPTSGYYALLHGKEVIAPYDKAQKLLGGGSGNDVNVVVTGEIQGDKLVLLTQKIIKRNSRLGGPQF